MTTSTARHWQCCSRSAKLNQRTENWEERTRGIPRIPPKHEDFGIITRCCVLWTAPLLGGGKFGHLFAAKCDSDFDVLSKLWKIERIPTNMTSRRILLYRLYRFAVHKNKQQHGPWHHGLWNWFYFPQLGTKSAVVRTGSVHQSRGWGWGQGTRRSWQFCELCMIATEWSFQHALTNLMFKIILVAWYLSP